MVVIAIVAMIAAIGIPQIVRSRTTAHESTAVGNLRSLANALAMYQSANHAFPGNWQADLYLNADPDYAPQQFNIDLQAGWVTLQGYRYRYRNPAGPSDLTYVINVHPASAFSGTRTFWADEREDIVHCVGTSTSLTIPATTRTLNNPPEACS